MHYYSYVVGCAFFAVWLIFYSICDLRSRSLKGYLTKQLPVLFYIPTGSEGRWSSSGIEIECKGSKQKIPTKEPFPDVYYVDSARITYK